MSDAEKKGSGGALRVSPEARILPILELVARAATEPDVWSEFVAALSRELDDAAVVMTLELPNTTTPIAYRVHSRVEFGPVFRKFSARGELPWPLALVPRDSFGALAELFPVERVPSTAFYQEFMEPQGFAPEGPLGHIFGSSGDRVLAGIAIYRRLGKRAFTPADLAWLDLLVPHLSQAYHVHSTLRALVHRRGAYQEVLDRFPIGVVLLDGNGAVLASNRAARRIDLQGDGFSLAGQRASATMPSSDVTLQQAVRSLLSGSPETGLGFDEGFTIERTSGLRPFAVMVSGVLASPRIGTFDDAVGAIYISDPESRPLEMRSLLSSFYQLTPAESELAALLCEGDKLEDAARARGVSLHTARSQLKRIFAKTNTKRQADLVGLVTIGLTNLSAHDEQPLEAESHED